MPSAINPANPTAGNATTASVRQNFQAAKTEIEALQTGLYLFDRAVVPNGQFNLGQNTLDWTTLYDFQDNPLTNPKLPQQDVIAICNVHWRIFSNGVQGEHEGGITSYTNSTFSLDATYHQMLFDTYMENASTGIGKILHEKHSLFLVPVHWTGTQNLAYVERMTVAQLGVSVADYVMLGYFKRGPLG